jgi:hypothetical protein
MNRIEKLEKYGRFPIPYIVFRDRNNIPHFKVNDEKKVEECIEKDLCSICGRKMNEDKWLIGGKLSAFHERGCYIDVPVHKECGVYALKNCPYMAYTQYTAKGVSESEKAVLLENEKLVLINPTLDNNRLPYFVFIKIESYSIVRKFTDRYIYPKRPYLKIEYWKDGNRLSEKEVNKIDPELKNINQQH